MPFKVTWPFLTIMWIGGTDEVAYQNKGESKLYILRYKGLCTKNTSRALIERPYSCAPQAVGAVYDRPGFFVQSPSHPWQTADINMQKMFRFTMQTFRRKIRTLREYPRIF